MADTRAIRPVPEGRPGHTADELLGCLYVRSIGPPACSSQLELNWWDRAEALFVSWLGLEAVRNPSADLSGANFAASLLLNCVNEGGDEYSNSLDRKPFSFAGLGGAELLFGRWAISGVRGGSSGTVIAGYLHRFAQHLTEHGFIPHDEGAALDQELEVWVPRVSAYFDEDGPWYEPDGSTVVHEKGRVTITAPDGTVRVQTYESECSQAEPRRTVRKNPATASRKRNAKRSRRKNRKRK